MCSEPGHVGRRDHDRRRASRPRPARACRSSRPRARPSRTAGSAEDGSYALGSSVLMRACVPSRVEAGPAPRPARAERGGARCPDDTRRPCSAARAPGGRRRARTPFGYLPSERPRDLGGARVLLDPARAGAWSAALIVLVYWVVAYVIVVSDDREPTITLAWLAVLYAIPLLGHDPLLLLRQGLVVGRKTRFRAGPRAHGPATSTRSTTSTSRSRRSSRRATTGGFEEKIVARDRGAQPRPAAAGHELRGPPERQRGVPAPARGPRRRQALHPHAVLHLGAATSSRPRSPRSCWTASRRASRSGSCTTGAAPSSTRRTSSRQLAAAGAEVHADVKGLGTINYRNHRKITVVDGEIGHTGGLNIGQEYIDGGKAYPAWRDTGHPLHRARPSPSCRSSSPSRWYDVTGEMLMDDKYLPGARTRRSTTATRSCSRSSPTRRTTRGARRRAPTRSPSRRREKTVRIQSPYFVPSESIYDAMLNAALAGVDVQFMMTGWPDHKSAFYGRQVLLAQVPEGRRPHVPLREGLLPRQDHRRGLAASPPSAR